MSKILFVSIPKCGTHIGVKLLDAAGFTVIGHPCAFQLSDDNLVSYLYDLRPGMYNAWHFVWTKNLSEIIQSLDIKIVFLYRDPRAQITSNMHFIMKTPHHRLHAYFVEKLKTSEERLRELIVGFSEEVANTYCAPIKNDIATILGVGIGPSSRFRGGINNLYKSYSRWLCEPNTITVRFEDFIGSRGGGSDDAQRKTIHEILLFIGISPSDSMVETFCNTLYDRNSNTFNKGIIDSWKEDFTPNIEELFKQECSVLMKLWGYELAEKKE